MKIKNKSTRLLPSKWFQAIREALIQEFELIEKDYAAERGGETGRFQRKKWDRPGGGGGEMAMMKGQVFEKVGVNFSEVYGEFSDDVAGTIPGTENDKSFSACGVSLVAHMHSPLVPASHFNTRYLETKKFWFGGGGDLTPTYPDYEETKLFHHNFKETCDRYDEDYYPQFAKACDKYFFLRHRKEPRGVGGIFFDYLNNNNFQGDFDFVKDVGRAFKQSMNEIIRKKMFLEWSDEQKQDQLIKRGRYVEFNLLYDRGTKFGLDTDGNIDAIMMSMPPLASWG